MSGWHRNNTFTVFPFIEIICCVVQKNYIFFSTLTIFIIITLINNIHPDIEKGFYTCGYLSATQWLGTKLLQVVIMAGTYYHIGNIEERKSNLLM